MRVETYVYPGDPGGLFGNVGRFGGAVVLILGLGGCWGSYALHRYGWLSENLGDTFFGWVIWGMSLVLVVHGLRAIRAGVLEARRRARRASPDEMLAMVRTRALPFHGCVACNSVVEADWGNGCPVCGSGSEFLPATTEAERKTLISAVRLDD
ncbi:MAG: hypothetical protein AAGA54_23230 [Myxococcota bacterium]